MTILIAGGGIAGLTLALSCHQVGIPFKVFEAAREMRPMGVGINLQPNAVRELYALGLRDQLAAIGVQTGDYGLYTTKGQHVWSEPRGKALGYEWPQYSIHRGDLLMLLYRAVLDRSGPKAVECGWRAVGFSNETDAACLHLQDRTGQSCDVHGLAVIGADGIHSAIRSQMFPQEGPPIWSGAILWRGITRASPFLSGASMVICGPRAKRVVAYPISQPDPSDNLATINWICERSFDPNESYRNEDYGRLAEIGDFLPHFGDMRLPWLDIPALVRGAGQVFEYPMVDRDPLDRWTFGRVTLIGDAAHATYPVGSNGAGAGIIDARKLVAALLSHGIAPEGLTAYEDEMRPSSNRLIEMNRGSGPDKILELVEQRSQGQFDDLDNVITKAEMDAHHAAYKRVAGTGIAETNDRPDIIPPGIRFNESLTY